jgi:hypothetical protein
MSTQKVVEPVMAERFGDNRSNKSSLLVLCILAAAGIVYYGAFYNYAFHWTDEGSVALLSERLSAGERPYIDIEPGYGVLWFYPLALLFEIFGVRFSIVRIYFLTLAFVTSLVSYSLMFLLTKDRRVALTVAMLVLLLPGTIHKTYIPLLVIAGAYVLFLYDARTLEPTVPAWVATAGNGMYLALSFLVRGDIATVYAVLVVSYHGLTGLHAALRERNWARAVVFPRRILGFVIVAAVVTLPFALQAAAGGYEQGFIRQYSTVAMGLISNIQARLLPPSDAATAVAGTLLARAPLLRFREETQLVFLTYAPLLVFLSIGLFLFIGLLRQSGTLRGVSDFLDENIYLVFLSIGALSAFPQFFVFRPDMAHLSQFLPGFLVLCGYFSFLLSRSSGAGVAPGILRQWGCRSFVLFCIAYVLAFANRYDDGFKCRRGRDQRFRVEDRIDVYLNRGEFKLLNQLNSAISESSRRGEFVLCFPYCPGINFIAVRPTFQRSLYVDDSYLVLQPEWLKEMRQQIVAKRPRVIVIWNWDVNGTEISRFPNWAAPLYRFIVDTYRLKSRIPGNGGAQDWYEVYVLDQ